MYKQINVKEHFGAKGDGVTDDTLAISGAIAGGTSIYFPQGTYKLTSPLSFNKTLMIFGESATILSEVSGVALTFAGNVILKDLTFDGNDYVTLERLVNYAGTSSQSINIDKCTFKNMKSNTYAYALAIGLCDQFRVTDCSFSAIRSVINGVAGDTNGSVRAIIPAYNCNRGLISNCYFTNVNNVTSSGTFAAEDADAIQCTVGGGTYQAIDISDCKFDNCGKRCIKVQGKSGCKYNISNCTMSSSFTGTPDIIGSTDNGMYSAIAAFAGHIKIDSCQFISGVCTYFCEASTAELDSLEITNSTYYPEYHRYSWGSSTGFLYAASTIRNNAKIAISNNNVKNVYFAIDKYNGSDITINGNNIGSQSNCIGLNSSGNSICSNNNLYFLNASAISGNPYTFYLGSGFLNSIFSNNIVDGLGDGVYLAAQAEPPVYKLVVTGNTFNNLTRNIFSNFNNGRAPYVYFDNNNPNTTVMLSKAGKVHTYTTAAPTSGSGYVGDIVWNTAPAASGFIGWVCTTSGAPGTWKTFGPITA